MGRIRMVLAVVAAGALFSVGVVFAAAATTGDSTLRAANAQYTHPSGGGGGGGLNPDLSIQGTAEPAQPGVGTTITWRLSVALANYSNAEGVMVDIALPSNVSLTSSYSDRGPGCAAAGQLTVHCNLDWLSGSLVAHLIIQATVQASGGHALTASVSSNRADPVLTNNSVTVSTSAPVTTTTTASSPPSTGSGGETKTGSAKDDILVGTRGNDKLDGGKGNDVIKGGLGNDRITGGPGRDHIFGGPGNDTIFAVDGEVDVIDCGAGHDTVYADRNDKVAKNCETVHRK